MTDLQTSPEAAPCNVSCSRPDAEQQVEEQVEEQAVTEPEDSDREGLQGGAEEMTYAACSPPPIKPMMSDFVVIKPIASGGSGTVNLVRHNQTHELLAMKTIKLRSKAHRDIVLMEHDVMSYLDHPLVSSMFYSFEEQDNLYMVMEYVGGGDCLNLFNKRKLFSEDMARFYMAELVLAVEYIHRLGIIHRDIKPDNLMITATGHLKLVDFGVSTICSVKTTACETEEDCLQVAREFNSRDQYGTSFYVAPEVWLCEGYGTPVDWWAVGVTFFSALYGRLPFRDDCREDLINHVVNGDIEWPVGDHPVSDEARSLVLLLLEKDPVKRLGTRGASEVKQHPFFKGVDWTNLLNQLPPLVPVLVNEEDTSCLDAMPVDVSSSTEEVQEEPMDEELPGEAADFSYVAFNFRKVYIPEPLPPGMLAGQHKMVTRKNPVKRFFTSFFSFLHSFQDFTSSLLLKTEKPEKKNPVKRFFQRLLTKTKKPEKKKNPVKRFFRTLLMKTKKPEKKKMNPVKRFFKRRWRLNPFRHFRRRLHTTCTVTAECV